MSRNASLVARTVSHLAGGAAESATVSWAEQLAQTFESFLTANEANEAALLSAIGMAKHERLVSLRKRVLENPKALEALKNLEARFKADLFASPGVKEPTIADAILVWSARDVVDYVLEPADRVYEYPSSSRWLEACLSHDAFKKAKVEEAVHDGVLDCDAPSRIIRGQTREGGMIDAKPESTDARRAADKVKELNANYKKQMTQRQKEKAAVVVPTPIPEAQALSFTLGHKIASSDPEKIQKCIRMVLSAIQMESLDTVEHPPAMDGANLGEALASKPGIKCKNLFLKCKKPKNETDSGLQLVCCPVDRSVDLKWLQSQLQYRDQLRFANADALLQALDIIQGNVTPFALVNDPQKVVNIVLDADMMADPNTLLWFHPLENTASVGIPAAKLVEFVKASGRNPLIIPLSPPPAEGAAAVSAPPVKAQKAESVTSAKKSNARGGEGAPVPQKKTVPPPVVTTPNSPPSSSPTAKKAESNRPKTLEEAIEREEQALEVVKTRQRQCEEAFAALEAARTGNGDPMEAVKTFNNAVRSKKQADVVFGNAASVTESMRRIVESSTKTTQPLVFTLTHELAQDRLWVRLHKLLGAPPKRLEGVSQGAEAVRPKGHDTHNLLIKDSKSKQLYMVCLRQDREIDLAALGEKLKCTGNLRLAGPADVETSIALTRGCLTPLSLYNNPQNSVIPVFDSVLLEDMDKKMVICAGCDDPHNHVDHNCVEVSMNQILQIINEGCKREYVRLEI